MPQPPLPPSPDIFPPEPVVSGASTLIRNGIFQSDCDAMGYRILNLDVSNLAIPGIPSQPAILNNWFSSYDSGTHLFGLTQPAFSNIAGDPRTGTLTVNQQRAIGFLGTIVSGTWNASIIQPLYLPTLDQINQPANNVNLKNNRIVNLADPVGNLDAVNLETLIAHTLGPPNPKAAVAVASTISIPLRSGLLIIDGYQTIAGDRILVKNQSGHAELDGVYIAAVGAWSRSDDMDDGPDFTQATCFVLNGTVNIGTTWLQTDIVVNVGVDQQAWVLLSTQLALDAGNGLQLIGDTLSVVGTAGQISVGTGVGIDPTYPGQMSINTLGTIDVGVWQGTAVTPQFGGTGVNNGPYTVTLAGSFQTSLAFGAPIGSFLTFALAGSSTLTLPTLGTLATLNGNEIFTNKHINASQIDSGLLSSARLPPYTSGTPNLALRNDGLGNLFWG